MTASERPDPNDPRERVRLAMRDIGIVCNDHGVRIVTRISVEQTKGGDRALVDSEWAVAALKDWPPKDSDPE